MSARLTEWLATLDEQRLAGILHRRPDVLAGHVPTRLNELAELLADPHGVATALRPLDAPAVQVALAVLVLQAVDDEPGIKRGGLAEFLDTGESELAPALVALEERAIAWTDAGGRVHPTPALHLLWPTPLGFGNRALTFLDRVNGEEIKAIARRLGVDATGRKQQTLDLVLDFLRDPKRMTILLEGAPADARELLEEFVWLGPRVALEIAYSDTHYSAYSARWASRAEYSPLRWARERGLVWLVDWEGVFEMPLEVGLALRGPDYRAPFTPEPPEVPLSPISPEGREHEASTAALRALDRFAALLQCAAAKPIAPLKSGAVGVKELRRLARDTSGTEDETRLHLEVAGIARLLAWNHDAGGFTPTVRFDAWRLEPAAERLAFLCTTWWNMRRSPLRHIDSAGGRRSPFSVDDRGQSSADVRQVTMRVLRDLPDDAAPVGGEDLSPAVEWHCPMIEPLTLRTQVESALAEATLLAASVDGAITDLGRALAGQSDLASHSADGTDSADAPADSTDDHRFTVDSGVVAAAEKLLARAQQQARFGADLTAVVTGPPSTHLAQLLDGAARREANSAATVWRFDQATVRRALDAGQTAPQLLDALAHVAHTELPQPLVYLIQDVGRRHGEVHVVNLACCVTSQNPVLLKEIVANRRLVPLRPHLLASTVLASALPATETLAALREAGYAPVAATADGTVTIEGPGGARAPMPTRSDESPRTTRSAQRPAVGADRREIARTLLAGRRGR